MLEYNEKIYKKVTNSGSAGVVLGVLIIITGIVIGTLSIVYGGSMLSVRKHLVD